jgi:hypothetical protein
MHQLGKRMIEERTAGVIDPGTAYMKVSAYKSSSKTVALNPTKKSAIIMAHDFFDSPHCWGPMLFEDFHEWLEFVCETARTTSHDFYLKPHPNAVEESAPVLAEFFKRYPEIKIVDPDVSNLSIAKSGFTCAFTLYGTIAHEFAYLGLPTISAGTNPHSAFSFTRTPENKETFTKWIKELPTWEPNREEIYEFLFMHNFCFLKDQIPNFKSVETSAEMVRYIQNEFSVLEAKMKAQYHAILNNEGFYH